MSKSSSVSVCLLEPSSRSIARKRALLRMARVNSNRVIRRSSRRLARTPFYDKIYQMMPGSKA